MHDDCCGNCKFWKSQVKYGDDFNLPMEDRPGQCRFYPPAGTERPYWPVTQGSEYCGEHKRDRNSGGSTSPMKVL